MDKRILGLTPFERPDVALAAALARAGAFPVLHLGRCGAAARAALGELRARIDSPFGVCAIQPLELELPAQVSLLMAPPAALPLVRAAGRTHLAIVTSLEEAEAARRLGVDGLVLKGCEAAGAVGTETTFILFQKLRQQELPLWAYGGCGLHGSAALVAAGAAGVVLDSQWVLFAECSAPRAIKEICARLDGSETRVMEGVRVLVRPESPARVGGLPRLLESGFDLGAGFLPLGQDVALSRDLVDRARSVEGAVFALGRAMHADVKLAREQCALAPGAGLAAELGTDYPIAQGPMTRVSDTAAFAHAAADAGALPFLALSLLQGDAAQSLLRKTREALGSRPWGVGVLGFVPPALREEQLRYILEVAPPVVLIAGGRPSQARPLEAAGIKAFLHVPSAGLLDAFLKEGARRFVFEGRECGGHVGPLTSFVLWERQIARLLQEDSLRGVNLLFAGGVHDGASAAIVSIMAAPLVARGAKIGVLMGTAYLYTREAVECGAILPQFQQQALAAQTTVLLESAPGHQTRCLETPFAAFFNSERRRLEAAGTPSQEIWAYLEELNVGRLRLAAKGLKRDGDRLLEAADDEQLRDGMYMIGQLAALRRSTLGMRELHEQVSRGSLDVLDSAEQPAWPQAQGHAADVAIVGMAGIFPGAADLDEFWNNIVTARDCITEVPDERWDKARYYDPQSRSGEKTPSKWGGFIGETVFEPTEFGIPPQSLPAIEPTQLLALQVARRALADAGYQDRPFDRENTSVIFGVESGTDLANSYGFRALYPQLTGEELPPHLDAALPRLTEDSFPGVLANVVSGRIANRLDLGGRNFAVDAACASSLAAIEIACSELICGRASMVLAGGADLHNGIKDYLLFSSTHALSPSGKCRTFDASADGIALGEGVAAVVLKRLADARRDGDRVYAVIRGIAGSSDGRSLGLTAPRKLGQVRALERAYAQARLSPTAVELIEAHGTGTVVGDRTELASLTELFMDAGATRARTQVGSVKTQIGHTKCAAGIAGLIKAALAIHHGVRPPTINLARPNPFHDPQVSPLSFEIAARPWLASYRCAGVSAFGFGGTNYHAVLDNAGLPQASPASRTWPAELLLVRGATAEAALGSLRSLADFLRAAVSASLRDIAYTVTQQHLHEPVQFALVAQDVADLERKIAACVAGEKLRGVFRRDPRPGKVAFLFPGQGSQRVDMARGLFVRFPRLRAWLNDHPQFEALIFPAFEPDSEGDHGARLRDTRNAQPALGIVSGAIAQLLAELGIEPDMIAGHSYGELPAACAAGALDWDDLIPLSGQRAAAVMHDLGEPGGMLAVLAPVEAVQPLLGEGTWIANENSPRQTVASGTTAGIARLHGACEAAGLACRALDVACAFHSPLLREAPVRFAAALDAVLMRAPSRALWSNTGVPCPPDADALRSMLAAQLVSPVRFATQLRRMHADGARVFIEVGPGRVLTQLTTETLGEEVLAFNTEGRDADGLSTLLEALGQYAATGREFDVAPLFAGREARRLDLDDAARYRPGASAWLINGQRARPAHAPPPGARPRLPVAKPAPAAPPAGSSADQALTAYLSSVSQMVQAQRDVMLAFLGSAPPTATAVATTGAPMDAAALAPPPVVPQAAVAAEPEPDVAALLLGIVADKTGYPPEMLGLDLDLEADLSIDSIKRMEILSALRAKLDVAGRSAMADDAGFEALARLKTLRALAGWLGERTPATEPPAAVAAAPQPARDARALLLGIVSSRTGYPVEMLDLDLDLEADLSIDSIKRMEIVSALRAELGSDAAEVEDAALERLARQKTLKGMLEWISGLAASSAAPQEPPDTALAVAPGGAAVINRRRLVGVPAPLGNADPHRLQGLRFGIAATRTDLTVALCDLLTQHGATAALLAPGASGADLDGLVMFDAHGDEHPRSMKEYLALVQSLDPARARYVFTVSAIDDARLPLHYQGLAGFVKSLGHEWEHAHCRAITLSGAVASQAAARHVLDELLTGQDEREIVYLGGVRQRVDLVSEDLPQGPATLELGRDAVILVFGGSRGITAKAAVRLSQEYPCRYVLVGKSRVVDDVPDEYAHLPGVSEIRRALVESGAFSAPAQIEARARDLHRANQLRRTREAIERNGGCVEYHAVDIQDEPGLERFVDGIVSRHGRLDGVIHGGGAIEDKLVREKTHDSFERVYRTKVAPLSVLSRRLTGGTRFVVFFSSVASVFGNRGQADYAAANDVLDRFAQQWDKAFDGKVISINWGPWQGAGMVSDSLEREYARRGLALIPVDRGVDCFVQELKYGNSSQVVIAADFARSTTI